MDSLVLFSKPIVLRLTGVSEVVEKTYVVLVVVVILHKQISDRWSAKEMANWGVYEVIVTVGGFGVTMVVGVIVV
jgi:hypothetical protein